MLTRSVLALIGEQWTSFIILNCTKACICVDYGTIIAFLLDTFVEEINSF